MRVLVLTDHPERAKLVTDLLGITIDVLLTSERCLHRTKSGRSERLMLESAGQPPVDRLYHVVVLDMERQALSDVMPIERLLAPEGAVITLNWRSCRFGALLQGPAAAKPVVGTTAAAWKRWEIDVEPSLSNPRALAICSHVSPIRRCIEWTLGPFGRRRHSALVLSSRGTSPPILRSLHDVIPQLGDNDDRLARSIRSIAISTTQVLRVQFRHGVASYFARFPLNSASEKRLRNQQDTCTYIHRHGSFSTVPQPVVTERPPSVPCFVERSLHGRSLQQLFRRLPKQAAIRCFSSALEAIRPIHERLGRLVKLGEGEFSRHVSSKLQFIVQQLSSRHPSVDRAAAVLERRLREALLGRAVLVTVSHGDFKIANCLFDRERHVSGIVDWDLSSRKDLALIDLATLRGRSIRERCRAPLAALVLHPRSVLDEFEKACKDYADRTQADHLPLSTLLWIYWLDRVYKQLRFDSEMSDLWIEKNVAPVLETLSS